MARKPVRRASSVKPAVRSSFQAVPYMKSGTGFLAILFLLLLPNRTVRPLPCVKILSPPTARSKHYITKGIKHGQTERSKPCKRLHHRDDRPRRGAN